MAMASTGEECPKCKGTKFKEVLTGIAECEECGCHWNMATGEVIRDC